MSQIEELQSRITAAMDRIGAGLVTLAEQQAEMRGDAAAADGQLAVALEEEKLANAQLQERVKTIKARHAEELETLRAELANSEELDSLKAEMAALKAELDNSADAEALTAELEAGKAEVTRLNGELEEQAAEIARLTAELAAQQADTSAAEALQAEVETARADATAAKAEAEQLTADLARQSELADTLKTEFDKQSIAAARLDMDVQRLRQSNDQLRDANTALREANEQGVGEPHLINKAMLAELEGLRAARATDVAEAGAVLARLEPLLATAANLPDGEED